MNDDLRSRILNPSNGPLQRTVDRRGALVILWQVLTAAGAKPLAPPEAPAKLAEMPLLLRLFECLRLFLLDVEFALSPAGHLRGFAKFACRIAIVLGALLLTAGFLLSLAWLIAAIAVAVAGMLVELLQLLLEGLLLLTATIAVGMAIFVLLNRVVRRPLKLDSRMYTTTPSRRQ